MPSWVWMMFLISVNAKLVCHPLTRSKCKGPLVSPREKAVGPHLCVELPTASLVFKKQCVDLLGLDRDGIFWHARGAVLSSDISD